MYSKSGRWWSLTLSKVQWSERERDWAIWKVNEKVKLGTCMDPYWCEMPTPVVMKIRHVSDLFRDGRQVCRWSILDFPRRLSTDHKRKLDAVLEFMRAQRCFFGQWQALTGKPILMPRTDNTILWKVVSKLKSFVSKRSFAIFSHYFMIHAVKIDANVRNAGQCNASTQTILSPTTIQEE